ncbi:hypothetical protein D4764_12G0011120 [Takifugu flavidus]|uniref:Uncharacterized protein n=1 Tax=Takifugu flavidus TaxID=433684 RepID=A0A5C6PD62_9TELE|nr:hypothetical protein D4764_12G0011120 [Takifugu flavidus]
MMVHIFGTTLSSSVATFALQKCATDFTEEFGPETAQTIRKNFYVDDCLKPALDEDKAITVCRVEEHVGKGSIQADKVVKQQQEVAELYPRR